MALNNLFQKRMFLLVTIVLLISIYLGGIKTGYNFTVGWAWDLNYL